MKRKLPKTFFQIIILGLFLQSQIFCQTVSPDLGQDIHICRTNTGTISLELLNKSDLNSQYLNLNEYKWVELIGGLYLIHKHEQISSFDSIKSLTIPKSDFKVNRTFRLIISGLLPEDSSEISGNEFFIYDDILITVEQPKLEVTDSVLCEGSVSTIKINWCGEYNISNCIYQISTLGENSYFPLANLPFNDSLGSFLITSPHLDSINTFEDQFIYLQGVLILNEGDTFMTDIRKIKVINLRPPGIRPFHYLCGSSNEIHLDLGGRDASQFRYNWFYRNPESSIDSLIEIDSDSINLALDGFYSAIIYRIDSINEVICYSVSPEIQTISQNVPPEIICERPFLIGLEDSIKIELNFNFPEEIRDLIRLNWFKDGNLIFGEISTSLYAKEPGVYSAVIYDLCEDSTNSNLITILLNKKPNSLNNYTSDKKNIYLFPNPSDGRITLNTKSSNWIKSKILFNVTDINGKIIESGSFVCKEENLFNFNHLSKGGYFLNLENIQNEEVEIFKFIIIH
jgi:hypothetical protein